MTRNVALFLFFLITGYINCNLIVTQDVGTKDVPIPREDFDNNDLKPSIESEIATDVIPLPMGPDTREPGKDCAKIGEFCNSHSDCCSRACLGYRKRCVSSSNLYPDYIDPHSA